MAQSKKPVVLVTGASAGIGEAICRRFAEGGYNIVAVARRKEKLDALAKSLAGKAEVAVVVAADTPPTARPPAFRRSADWTLLMSSSMTLQDGRFSRIVRHANLSNSNATRVSKPASSKPKSRPPIPLNRLIVLSMSPRG